MTGFKRRLAALEGKVRKVFKPWVRIIQEVGETREEAVAKWEADNGKPFDDEANNIIWRIIVAPKAEAAPHG